MMMMMDVMKMIMSKYSFNGREATDNVRLDDSDN